MEALSGKRHEPPPLVPRLRGLTEYKNDLSKSIRIDRFFEMSIKIVNSGMDQKIRSDQHCSCHVENGPLFNYLEAS